jgi:hypothetical protein
MADPHLQSSRLVIAAQVEASAQHPKQMEIQSEKAVAFAARRRSAWRHDVFNLFALAIINALNFWFLWFGNGVACALPCRCFVPFFLQPQNRDLTKIAPAA